MVSERSATDELFDSEILTQPTRITLHNPRFEGLSHSCFMHKLLDIRQFHQNTKLEI